MVVSAIAKAAHYKLIEAKYNSQAKKQVSHETCYKEKPKMPSIQKLAKSEGQTQTKYTGGRRIIRHR